MIAVGKYDLLRHGDLAALGHYQRVWDGRSPEWQADFYADTTGPLPANEWPMVDIETGVSDPAGFLLRWLGRYESRWQRRAAVYAPLALWTTVLPVIGDCNRTDLTAAQILARTRGRPVSGNYQRRVQMLND